VLKYKFAGFRIFLHVLCSSVLQAHVCVHTRIHSQSDRQTDTDIDTDKDTDTEIDIDTETQTRRHVNTQAHRQTRNPKRLLHRRSYGLATISRLLKIVSLFCRISSIL